MCHPWGYHYTLHVVARKPFRSDCTNSLVDDEGVQIPSMVFDMWFQYMWSHILSNHKWKRKATDQKDGHLSVLSFKILNLVPRGKPLKGESHDSVMKTRDQIPRIPALEEDWSGPESEYTAPCNQPPLYLAGH